MELAAGSYEVEASAPGYATKTETVLHGATPTVHRLALSRPGQPFTIAAQPAQASVRLVDHPEAYRPGMLLPPGSYGWRRARKATRPRRRRCCTGQTPTMHRLALSRPGQPFTIVAAPAQARVRLVDHAETYRPGMLLPPGSYRVEASAEGYETMAESVAHGAEPTMRRIALRKAGPQVGDRFRDCPECPQMVVLPTGSYRMGSPSYEQGHFDWEGPVHEVTIGAPFAVGRYEVTFAEWDACARDGGCPRGEGIAKDRGWGRGRRPVIYVSWDDAKRYVQWLSRKTGKAYRLPSESEWEYAARAGTQTAYSWGDEIGVNRASCRGCGSQWVGGSTAPVGSFGANAWDLHDMHGNVWEWVEDCWNDSYAGAPVDGSAWLTGNCDRRVLRGGSRYNYPSVLRAAYRLRRVTTDIRNNIYGRFGFRVARTLAP